MTLIIVLVAVGILAFYAIIVYNKLVGMRNKVKEGESDIDVQLKRRHDLIPSLIDTVKGAKNFEQETLENVIKARQQAVDFSSVKDIEKQAAAENMLTGALRQLFALSEAYPDLKSNQNFLQLQEELTNTEDRILASRRFYNSVVEDYNTYQIQFPAVLFRGLAGAKEEPFFELEDPTEKKVPEINFD